MDESYRLIEQQLKLHVKQLAHMIGVRNYRHYNHLVQAADYIEQSFIQLGYAVNRHPFSYKNQIFYNIEATWPDINLKENVLVVGAHYDTIKNSAGANDNASGISAMLELARLFSLANFRPNIRWVAFANEEPPFIRTPHMGSYHYAQWANSKQLPIIGALVLETLGYYSNKPASQKFSWLLPRSLYPDIGNFVAFIGNRASRSWLENFKASFKQQGNFPCWSLAAPSWLPGSNSSDHWAFWQHGYPAIMITDTGPFRYSYYHSTKDTYDKLDYATTAQLVLALFRTLQILKL